jgi:hypothetical protein
MRALGPALLAPRTVSRDRRWTTTPATNRSLRAQNDVEIR